VSDGWALLLDENIDPATTTHLETERIEAEHVLDVLGAGADDETEVLPYALEENRLLVTSDLSDFTDLPPDAHAGIVLLYDDTLPAHAVAAGLDAMIAAYPSRDSFEGPEVLDAWV
jgi:hypothetical protein